MAPQQISACRGRASALVLRIKDRMCLVRKLTPRTAFGVENLEVALHSAQLLYPSSLVGWSFVRPSARLRHREIRGKSSLDTTWPGSALGTKTLLPSNNPPLTGTKHRLSCCIHCSHRQKCQHQHQHPSAPCPTLSIKSLIMIRPTPPQNNHVSILQISVPGPNARNGPLAPLAGTSQPA